jgi:hypothetical protein
MPSDQQIKLGNINVQTILEKRYSLSLLEFRKIKIKKSAGAMKELKNYILKTEGDYIKKTKVYQLYSDMLSLNKIISHGTNNCLCPEILVKCKSMLNGAKQKLLFLGCLIN